MNPFSPILSILSLIHDPRRAQGKRYEQDYILLFSILAIITGANSYRGIFTFIRVHFKTLTEYFKLEWKKQPAHTAIRKIILGLKTSDIEHAFQKYAMYMNNLSIPEGACKILSIDGKSLRGSFDAFSDSQAKQILSAFAAQSGLTLAHLDIDDKSNEIPAAQRLIQELNLEKYIVTLDAIHCQKKHLRRQKMLRLMLSYS